MVRNPSGVAMLDEGGSLGNATSLNFVGAGVIATVVAGVGIVTIAGGSGADIATSTLTPTTDETIGANLSAVLVRSYKIASGKKLTLGLGSRFRIL